MKKSDKLTFEQLAAWIEGTLSAEEARLVREQVAAASDKVKDDLTWLREFYRASQEVVWAEPPENVVKRLEGRFAAVAEDRRRPSPWQRLLATLRFDSHTQLSAGVRTAVSPQSQRQLVYQADEATIILTLQKREQDGQLDLLGQILAGQEQGVDLIRVLLLQQENEFDSTITDDLGEFTLKALPVGMYDLVLSSHQYEIAISSVDMFI